jgi:GNAT superfamily N-acetyltransferase
VDYRIRTLRSDEWRLWRSLRLRAVEDSPQSFRGTLAEESAEADHRWKEMVERTAGDPQGLLLVVEADSDPMGMLFGRRDESSALLEVGAMWVDPEVRRNGIGRRLVNEAFDWARQAGGGRAELWVTQGNDAAERLFAGAGFNATGETEPLRDGSSLNVVRMTAAL